MHVAVLLLSCNDQPRRSSFSRDWAERCVSVAGDYYAAQSGGRLTLTWQVFDWLDLQMPEADWVVASSKGIDDVVTIVTPMLPEGVDLKKDFDHILVGIDSVNSSGGTTPGAYTYLGATNFTPSFIGHEFGHRFGAGDAFGKASDGGDRYENHFCVMGAMGWPYTFSADALVAEEAAGLDGAGPGMSAPTLMATGWLDVRQHNVSVDLTGSTQAAHGGVTVSLSALSGAPGVAWNRPPVALRYGRFVVEYRVPSGWDRGLPEGPAPARGWVVVHDSPPDAPVAALVDEVAAYPGAFLTLGTDNILDLGSPGPPTIRVLSVDTVNDVVHLSISQRAARGMLGSTSIGDAGGDGGGLVWTPGRGLHRIPPYSPLRDVLELVSDVAGLHELAAQLPAEQAEAINQRTAQVLQTLQESLAQVPAEAPLSPMQQAFNRLNTLDEARRRLEEEGGEGGLGQEYLDISRTNLEQLRSIVETAVRIERRQ